MIFNEFRSLRPHQNVTQLLGVMPSITSISIITPYYAKGTLLQFIRSAEITPVIVQLKILKGLLETFKITSLQELLPE